MENSSFQVRPGKDMPCLLISCVWLLSQSRDFLGGMRSLWKTRLFTCFSFVWFGVFYFVRNTLSWFDLLSSGPDRIAGFFILVKKVSGLCHLATGMEPTPFSRFLSSWETRTGGCAPDAGRHCARAGLEVHSRHILVQNLHFLSFLHYLDTSVKNPPQTGPSRL